MFYEECNKHYNLLVKSLSKMKEIRNTLADSKSYQTKHLILIHDMDSFASLLKCPFHSII